MLRALALVAALPACGRIDFDALAGAHDAAAGGDAGDDAPSAPVAWVQVFAARHPGAGAADTFATSAAHAGDAIVLEVACSGSTTPTAVTVTAPGWTFTPVDPIAGSTATQLYAASFVAIAPDTAATNVSVTWAGSTCDVGKAELGDELANVDAAGAIDRHAIAPGTGPCSGAVPTSRANDAVWGACFCATQITGAGPGYTKGADNAGGDWSEYKITTDPAGTPEQVSFASPNVGFVLAMATLPPR
ncbi:MAG: hypothetical protein ACM31C_20270 [Acidobacteriota bacterium]